MKASHFERLVRLARSVWRSDMREGDKGEVIATLEIVAIQHRGEQAEAEAEERFVELMMAPFDDESMLTAIGEPAEYDGRNCQPAMTVYVNFDARKHSAVARAISFQEAVELWKESPHNRVQFEIH